MKTSTESDVLPVNEGGLTTGVMAAHLNIPPHDLRYWVKSGLLTASIQGNMGKGSQLIFDSNDLKIACLIRRLSGLGVKPKQIKKILSEVRRAMCDPGALVEPLLVPCGTTQLILQRAASGRTMILDASRPGQYVLTIVLENLEEEARRILAQAK